MGVNYQQNKNLFYFYNFEIIHHNLCDYLFLMLELNVNTASVGDENTESVECIFNKNKILVKLENTTEDNKIVIEVGELNAKYVFEPELFLAVI